MAAALFARLREDNIAIHSAGTGAWPGAPASPNAVIAAMELGADCSSHQSQQATPELLAQADLVVCLAAGHAERVSAFVPRERLRVLGGGVSDPYGGDLDAYRACAAQINAALPSLLPDIRCTAQVIPTEESHAPAIAELQRQVFSPPMSEHRLLEKMALPTNHMLTAILDRDEEKPPSLEGGQRQRRRGVSGYISVDEISGEAFIDDIAVFPAYHRQGIASRLLARAETNAILRGNHKIHLEVRESNAPARKLYEARGYKAVGRRKGFYQQPDEDAILMTLEIR